MVAAHVDDLQPLRQPCDRLRRVAGRQRDEQQVQVRQSLRVPALDDQVSVAVQPREALAEPLAGTALAADIAQLEGRVPGAQPQDLSAAVAADPDDADRGAHGPECNRRASWRAEIVRSAQDMHPNL
jgi:hypothetical protein